MRTSPTGTWMRRLGMVVVVAVLCACGERRPGARAGGAEPSQDGGTAAPEDGGVQLPAIDPYRELVIVDSSVILDARASNAADGAWSFRRTAEQLAPSGMTPAQLVENWLRSFHVSAVGGRQVDDRPGVDGLLASWPRGADGSLDLSRPPFRLIAIASRLDLVSSPN